VQDVAITTLPWISRDGEVHANLGLADKIMNRLEVTEEHDVFDSEHGIKVIVPYIIKYFPGCKIVPIVQKDHKYIKSKLDLLVSVINEVIQNKEDCVVIISSDFSHYFDLDTTYKKDAVSEYYLKNQWDKELSLPECDNRNGLYILNRLGETNANYRNMHILKYSNSYEITGRNPENVTSYFFTYYYGNKK
jgi:AmmeMemoRadiSam system protein B